MSKRRNIKYHYLKTKMALNETVQAILNINRKRRFFGEDEARKAELNEELRVLNAVAENHAMRLRSFEYRLAQQETAA